MKINPPLPSFLLPSELSAQDFKVPHERVNKGKFKATSCYPLPPMIVNRIVGKSWNSDCPVLLKDLAYIQVSHWNMNGQAVTGELIYHKTLIQEIVDIFKELFDNQFPIEKMRLIERYDADDELSMAANNSYAFCSRSITGKPGTYSKHSYGCTIDINPLFNPYVKGDILLPKSAEPFLDRSLPQPGLIVENDVCYQAFAKRGYTWGGNWDKPYQDYHHFEKDPNSVNLMSSN